MPYKKLASSKEGVSSWKVSQKITALPSGKVRVKMCGKSARINIVICLWDKPHLEQDKVSKLQVPILTICGYVALDRWLPRYL